MILIVRGDLRSQTGWARATRSLIDALKSDFSLIVGVDIHHHPEKSRVEFPYPIVDDEAASKFVRQAASCVILHATLPPETYRMSGAINICWWFWETDTFSNRSDWAEHLDSMDAILVPSQWQADWLSRWKLKPPIFVVRWPHQESQEKTRRTLNGLGLYRTWSIDEHRQFLCIDKRCHTGSGRFFQARRLFARKLQLFDDTLVPFNRISDGYDGYFFAIQTDAPRKGLPILLNEWKTYRAKAKTNKALLIRFSALNVNLSPMELVERFMNVALSSSRGDVSALGHVFLLLDQISDDLIANMYCSADAYISPTYGEGFGGTIVESAFAGCPSIAPDHTACRQLLPENHRYKYKSFTYIGALVEQLSIQPSNGSWNIPNPGAISTCLLDAEQVTKSERVELARIQRDYLIELLTPAEAKRTFRMAVAAARRL